VYEGNYPFKTTSLPNLIMLTGHLQGMTLQLLNREQIMRKIYSRHLVVLTLLAVSSHSYAELEEVDVCDVSPYGTT